MATITMTETRSADPLDSSKWTTPQELCLLQSIMLYKPVGLHKHFRMLSIFDTLLSSGTIPQPISNHPHCSSIAGIWQKLNSLYDLKALDEREDALFGDVTANDDDDENATVIDYWREFELIGHDFTQRMWEQRFADTDEVWSDDGDGTDRRVREDTVPESDNPRSSPVGSVRGTRSSGRRAAVGRRLAEVKQDDSPAGASSGKGSRRTSKAASPSVKDEEDTEMQDVSQVDEDSEDEEDDSDQNETEDDSRKGRPSRGRGGRRQRGRRGRRGK